MGFAFVLPSTANPISLLSNQFRQWSIYACSGISRLRTPPHEESDESTGLIRMCDRKVKFTKTP
jgi:hypothetical protein